MAHLYALLPILLNVVLAPSEIVGDSPEVVLTDENWDLMLEGEWMIKFYAPWCPACRSLQETWTDFAVWCKEGETELRVASIDVTEQPALNGRFMITALPTIYHVKNGEFRQYKSSRSMEDFKDFVNSQQWQEISPVSSWTSPTSNLMSFMSTLFSFSMKLKSYHYSLNTEYGFPTWLSMLLFGLLIISVGLFFGIALVFVTDYIWGPPPSYSHQETITEKDEDDTRNDISTNRLETTLGDGERECEITESEAGSTIRQRNINSGTREE